MTFRMACPHCKRTLKVTEPAFGKTVPCPGCNQPIKVPHPTAVPSTAPVQARCAVDWRRREPRSRSPAGAVARLNALHARWPTRQTIRWRFFILNPVPPRRLPTVGHRAVDGFADRAMRLRLASCPPVCRACRTSNRQGSHRSLPHFPRGRHRASSTSSILDSSVI